MKEVKVMVTLGIPDDSPQAKLTPQDLGARAARGVRGSLQYALDENRELTSELPELAIVEVAPYPGSPWRE